MSEGTTPTAGREEPVATGERNSSSVLRYVRELLDIAKSSNLDVVVEEMMVEALHNALRLSQRFLTPVGQRDADVPSGLIDAADAWHALVDAGLDHVLTPRQHAMYGEVGGRTLFLQYAAQGRPEDLAVAYSIYGPWVVDSLSTLVRRAPNRKLAADAAAMGVMLRQGADQSSEVEHADGAVKLLEAVLEAAGEHSEAWWNVALELAAALQTRHRITGREEDLRSCQEALKEALATMPSDAPVHAAATAVRAARKALATEGANNEARAMLEDFVRRSAESVEADLKDGVERLRRYEEQGDPLDLDAAQSRLELAVAVAEPGIPAHAIALSALGLVLIKRHEVTLEPSILETAIEHLQEGLHRADGEPSIRPALLLQLGDGLARKYEHTSARENLDAAIDAYRAGLEEPSPHVTVTALLRAALGNALRMSWERDGESAQLDDAIELLDTGAADLPSGSDAWATARARLAASLLWRYETRGNLADVHTAVAMAREAVEATAERAPGRGVRLSGLARALAARGVRIGKTRDLDEAIALLQGLIEREPRSRTLANRLSDLGTDLLSRYDARKDPADLTAAVASLEQAVELTPNRVAARAVRLGNLGNALMRSYEAELDVGKLKRAVAAQREAVELADKRPDRASYRLGLADCLALLHDANGDHVLLGEAVDCYRRACCEAAKESPNVALAASRNWARSATARAAWGEATEASRYAVEATEDLFRRQYARADQEAWLELATPVPAMAAYAIARAGYPEEAVLALERTRALLLSDALERRAKLLDLRSHRAADLVTAYEAAAERVQWLERNTTSIDDR